MSETTTLEGLQKKRSELENHWSSQLEKHKTLEGDVKALEEKVQAQLQQKIRHEDQALETLETKRKDLAKRLGELQEDQELPPKKLDEPTEEVAETKEETMEEHTETAAAITTDDQSQDEEAKEKRKEEKKRKWM